MARIAPYNQVDFFDTRDALITFLKNQDRFKGYDFEGSNMSVLIDLLAYNTYNTLQYYNMSLGEMFLDSAQLRNSVVSHAKELNYIPRSPRSASARVTVQLRSSQVSNTFIIPRGTRLLGRCGNITYDFLTDEAYAAERKEGNLFEVADVIVYEGRTIVEVLPSDNTVISNPSIDTRSVRVFVNGVEYRYSSTIFGVEPTDPVFYLQGEINGKYSIQFGENIFGFQPTATDEISVQYRITSGEEGNGVNSYILEPADIGASSATVIPQGSGIAIGGSDAETTDSIRKFAPRAFQVQERAITAKDYEVLLRARFPQIESISVFGGDEAEPPQFGRVIVSVDVRGRDGASDSELQLFKSYIRDKCPISIEPIFQSADFMYADVLIEVKYDRNDALLSTAQLEEEIRLAVSNYSDDSLNDFDVGLIASALQTTLSQIDASIDSVAITTNPILDWSPPVDTLQSPSFNFGSALIKPYPYNATIGVTDFKPAFVSTIFTLSGTPVILQDDGNGNIVALVANENDRSVFRPNMGTIDYNRGIVNLKDIEVQSFVGGAIQLMANTQDKDVFAPKDKIVRIRQENVSVNIRPTR